MAQNSARGISSGSGGVIWTNDLAGSTSSSQFINSISGSAGTGGTVLLNITTLQFAAGQSFANISQGTTSTASGVNLTVQAQNSTHSTGNGGNLNLTSGTSGTFGLPGTVNLQTGGTTRLTASSSGVITIANLTTGVVQSDSVGNLSSTAISGDATISNTGVVQISQITGDSHSGGAGVVLWNNATGAPTSNPTGGSIVYEISGTLTQRGSGGLTVDIAPSGSGTINSQIAVINRATAFFRTTSAVAATAYSYTIPYSATVGAFVYIETKWSARDTSGTSTMNAAAGSALAAFSCTTGGTVTQTGVQVTGTFKINSNFFGNTGNGSPQPSFNVLTFDNTTTNRFSPNESSTPITYTTAASGVINIQVNPPASTTYDWTLDIYFQVT